MCRNNGKMRKNIKVGVFNFLWRDGRGTVLYSLTLTASIFLKWKINLKWDVFIRPGQDHLLKGLGRMWEHSFHNFIDLLSLLLFVLAALGARIYFALAVSSRVAHQLWTIYWLPHTEPLFFPSQALWHRAVLSSVTRCSRRWSKLNKKLNKAEGQMKELPLP